MPSGTGGYIYGSVMDSSDTSEELACSPLFNSSSPGNTSMCTLAVYRKTREGIVSLNDRKSSRVYLYIPKGTGYEDKDICKLCAADSNIKEVYVYVEGKNGNYKHRRTELVTCEQKKEHTSSAWLVFIFVVAVLVACVLVLTWKHWYNPFTRVQKDEPATGYATNL